MPLVADSFDRLSNTNIFSKLDFDQATSRCGLLQAMNRKLRVMRYGSFELFVMSFDLTNGPTTFYNLMNDVFHDYIDRFVVVYLNYIVVDSNSQDEYLDDLRKVVAKLREN